MNMTLRGGSCLGKNFGTPFRLFYPFQNFLVALTMAASAPLCDCWDFNSSGNPLHAAMNNATSSGNPLHAAMNNATSCDTVCVEYGQHKFLDKQRYFNLPLQELLTPLATMPLQSVTIM
jgi:hypothetical protein